jgi:hypothetical protein
MISISQLKTAVELRPETSVVLNIPQTMRRESVMPIQQGEPDMELAVKEFS